MDTQTQIASHLLRARLGKLCVALTAATPQELATKASAALTDSSFLEFRLDYLAKPAAALPALKAWLSSHGDATVIATCRCKGNGGRFAGSVTAELDILLAAAEAGFLLVDLELESAEKLPKNSIDRLRAAGAGVILSWHDFNSTPKDLEPVLKRMLPFEPDFIKIVPTAKALADNLTMMRFLGSAEPRTNAGLVGMCMGEAGIVSRVLGLRAGSAFTFASAGAGEETAPGQIAARTLIETYRMEQVDPATRVYGVAGNPITHSMSPVMLNTAFRRETVNAVYLALQTSKADDLFKLMREIPVHGLSVTMPLKQDVIPHLERTDALSQKIGAVNTIARMPDGKFYGFNTDVAGIIGPLERRLSLNGAKVLVLGAGGAARAAVFGCRDKGADVSILNRTPETAQKLARQSGAKAIKRDQLAKLQFDIVINCTPAGQTGNKTPGILSADELTAIGARLVFDTVYNPIDTPLLKAARSKGIAVITGVEMFVTQGARQFEIWTGKPAPDQEMLRVVLHALRHGAEPASDAIDPTAAATRVVTAARAAELAAAEARKAADAAALAAKAAPLAPAPVKSAPAKAVPAKAAAPVKAAAPAKPVPPPPPVKPVPAKAPAKSAVKPSAKKVVPAKKAAPARKAVAKKIVPAKKAVPVKKVVTFKKAAPTKKPVPAKKAAKAKKTAPTPAAKKVAKKALKKSSRR